MLIYGTQTLNINMCIYDIQTQICEILDVKPTDFKYEYIHMRHTGFKYIHMRPTDFKYIHMRHTGFKYANAPSTTK